MEPRASHATWLDLVSLRCGGSRAGQASVKLCSPRHADPGDCVGIELLLDDRPLVFNDGQRTVFCNLEAAQRFLAIAGIDDYETVARDADNDERDPTQAVCLTVSRDGLCRCPACMRAVARQRAA